MKSDKANLRAEVDKVEPMQIKHNLRSYECDLPIAGRSRAIIRGTCSTQLFKAMDAIACPAPIMDGSHMMIKQNGVRGGKGGLPSYGDADHDIKQNT